MTKSLFEIIFTAYNNYQNAGELEIFFDKIKTLLPQIEDAINYDGDSDSFTEESFLSSLWVIKHELYSMRLPATEEELDIFTHGNLHYSKYLENLATETFYNYLPASDSDIHETEPLGAVSDDHSGHE